MKIKELREKKGLTQKELAKELNIPYRNYNYYEKGINEPNINSLIIIANYFNVSLDYLTERKSNCFDLGTFTIEQIECIKKIKLLNDNQCLKASAYIDGLSEQNKIINNSFNHNKGKQNFKF